MADDLRIAASSVQRIVRTSTVDAAMGNDAWMAAIERARFEAQPGYRTPFPAASDDPARENSPQPGVRALASPAHPRERGPLSGQATPDRPHAPSTLRAGDAGDRTVAGPGGRRADGIPPHAPVVAPGASADIGAVTSTAARMTASGRAPQVDWKPRSVHVYVSDEGETTVWIRDTSLQVGDEVRLVERLREHVTQSSKRALRLTLNGNEIDVYGAAWKLQTGFPGRD